MNDPTATPTSPGDRATTFQAVEGAQPEHYSGEVLLVSAYAALYLLLIAWVILIWRKTGAMDRRLGDLEREIDKAGGAKLAAEK